MKTADQIVNDILTQLRLNDPTVSAEIGTPERKIIEAVAEQIARAQADFTVLDSQHDLEQMSGNRLDAYLGGVFAFGRQQPMPSVGVVTFARTEAATDPIIIPRGTQVLAHLDNEIYPDLRFVTTEAAVIATGGFSIDATVQCTVTGTVGNIPSAAVVGFAGLTSIAGISTVSNDEPMTGGVDGEDDAQYKLRFQNTLFRNMAGTYDHIMALAVAQAAVTKANVVGPLSRYQEYVLVPGSNDASQITRRWDGASYTTSGTYDPAGTTWTSKRTTAYSTIPYSKYTYLQQHFLTDGTLDPATAKFFRHGIDYVLNAPPNTIPTDSPQTQQLSTTPVANDSAPAFKPNITVLGDGGVMPEGLEAGNVVLFEHAYMSKNSRNDYALGIMNCIDVFINGEKPKKVNSVEVVPSGTTHVLQNTNTAVWNYQKTTATKVINFRRPVDGKASAVGSRVMPLYWQPVLDAPNSVTIGQDTYYRGNFWNSGDSFYYNVKKTEGTSTGGNTTSTLKDTKKSWTVNAYNNHVVEIVSGTGVGQSRAIASNTINTLTTATTWGTAPDKTSKYRVLTRRAHYVTTREVNGFLGTIRARSGIEWFAAGNNYLNGKRSGDSDQAGINGVAAFTGVKFESKAGTQFTMTGYTYDDNIASLQAILEKNKQTTTDILAHRARIRYFKPIVTIMYSAGSTRSVVDASIKANLQAFWQNQYFGAAIQLSDILQAIHNTPGVDNIRFTNDTGAGNKVEEVNSDGTTLEDGATYFTKDFFIQDSDLADAPSENWVQITARSQNTWST